MSTREISKQALVEREMRRLAVLVRVLSVVLLALLARELIDGRSYGIEVAAALLAPLLVVAVALRRKGRRLKVALSTSAQTPGRTQ